jgi:hypothetical protein
LAAADLSRPFHGVRLKVSDAAPSVRELARAYAKRMPRRQVFSHETAAHLWGVPLPGRFAGPGDHDRAAPLLHVSVPRGSSAPAARGVRGHVLDFAGLDVRVHRGLRLTGPAATWVQLGARLTVDDLVAAADFLVTGTEPYNGRPPLCTFPELAVALENRPGCRGAAALRAALALARKGPLSRRESLLRLDLVRADLPEPAPNHRVLDADGALLAMIDLAFPHYLVGIEYQSDLHRGPAQWRSDIRRLERLADAGWLMVQATSDDVSADGRLRDSAEFAERVRRRLRARGWPG